MNKTVVSFSVIKEKIIKTDEVLQMYKDTNTKLQKSQILCKEWKSKYENVSCGQERLELENYRINDSLKQLEDEHKHIVSQNEDLIRQLRKLEEQYNILSVSSQSSIKELQDELQISQELNNHCNTENSKKTFEETENKLMVEIDALKAKNNELSKKIAEMVIKSAESESLRTENSTLLGSIKILQQTVESSEAKAKTVDKKDQEIKKLLADLTDIKSKLENMQLDNSTLMRRIHEKDEELKKVKCKIVQESSTQTDEEISCNQAESRELEFEKSKISITGTKTRSDTDNKKSSLCTAFSQKSTVLDSDTEPIEYIFRDMLKLPKMISPIRSPALPNITLMAPTPPIENVQPADDFVVPSKTVRKHFPISAKKRRKKYKLSYISQDSQNIKQKQINKQIMHKKLLRRKMLRRIHMNKDSNLIDALRLLKKSNINFIIYNEPSESLKNPIYNSENHPHQHPQPQQYNTAVKIEPCLLRNCKSRPCHLMLNQTKEMLGFFNIKNEDTAAAHISTESIAKCESLSNLTTTYLDTIVERVMEKIEERGVMHHKRRMRNRRSDSFHSGTETEIEMCFQTSKADILERNKMLLEKAKYENANREENLLLNNSLTDDCTKDSGLSSSALERLSQSSLVTTTPHDATIQKIFLQYPMCPIVTPVKEAEAGNNSINKYLREHDSTMDTLNISNVELSQFLNLSELDISRKDNWFGITPTEEELIHIKNLTKSTAIPEGSKVPRKLFSDNLAKLMPNTIQSTELCPSVKCEVDEKMHDCQRKTIDCLKSPELCGTDKSDISTAKFIASTAQLQSQQKWLEDQNNQTNERIILVEPSIVIHKESSIHQLMEKCPEETIKTTTVKISDCTNINDSPKSPNIKVCPSETKISKKGIFNNSFSLPTLAKHSYEKASKISLHLDNVPNIKNVSQSFQSSYLYDDGTTSKSELLCMDIASDSPMSSKLNELDIKNVLLESAQYKVAIDKKTETVAISETIYDSPISSETTSNSQLLCMDIVSNNPMSSKLEDIDIKNVLLESSQSKFAVDKKTETVAVSETIYDSPMSPETTSNNQLLCMDIVSNNPMSSKLEDIDIKKVVMDKKSESVAVSYTIYEGAMSPETTTKSRLLGMDIVSDSPMSPVSKLDDLNIKNVLLESSQSKVVMDKKSESVAVSETIHDSPMSPETDIDSRNEAVSKSKLDLPSDADLCKMANVKNESNSNRSEDEALIKNQLLAVPFIIPDNSFSTQSKLGNIIKMEKVSKSFQSEAEMVRSRSAAMSGLISENLLSPEADLNSTKNSSNSHLNKNQKLTVSNFLPNSPLSPESNLTNAPNIENVLECFRSKYEMVGGQPIAVSSLVLGSHLSPEADFDKMKIGSSSYHSEDEAVSKNNPMSVSDILPNSLLSPEADFDKMKIGSSSYHSEDEAVSKSNPMSVSDILPDSPLSPKSNLGYVPKKIESKYEMFRSQSVTVSRLVSNSPLASEANFDKKNSSSSNLSVGKNQSTLPGIISDSTLSPKSDIDRIPKIKNISENSSGKNFDSPLSPKSHFNNLSNNENVYCQTKDKAGERSLLVSNNLQSLKRSDLLGKYQNKDKLPLSSKPFTKIDQSEMCFIEENASNPSNDIDKPEIPLAPVSSLKSDLTKEILSYLGTNTPTLSAPELETATNTSDKLITSSNEPLKHFDSGRRSKRLSQKLKCCSESVSNTKCYSFIDNINFDKKDNTCLPEASKPKCKEDEYVVKVLEPIKRKRGRPRAIVENRDLHIETKSKKTDGDNKQEEIISPKRPKIVISRLKSQIMRQLKVKRIMLRTEKDTVAIATSGTVNKPVKTNVICGTQTIPNKRKAIQNQNSEGNRKIKIMQNIVIKPGITSKEGLLNQQLIRSDLTTTIVSANQKECIGKGVKTIPLNKEKTHENCDKQVDILSRILTDMDKEKSSPVLKPLPQKHVNVTNSIGSEVWRRNLLDIAEIIHSPDYGDIGRDIFERSNNTPCSSLKNKNLNRKSKLLAKRLLQTATENDVPDNIILEFKRLEVDVIVELILHIVSKSEKEVPNPEYFPAPLMTRTQRILLTLMVRLQNENVGNIMDSFLGKAQQIVLRAGCGTQQLISITRLYVAICRLRADIYRIRLYCCEAFYRIGSLAVPLLFTVLTSWSEVFPHEKDLKNYPMAKLIVQIIDLKKYTLHDHHLIMLKSLLQQFYGYPSNRWDCDKLFDELTQQYLRSPTTSSGFALKLFCKYKDTQWVINKIETFFKPLIYKIPSENVNLKATVILLLGYICKQFNRNKEVEEKYLLDIERWFLGIIEDNPPELVKQSVQIILDILGKKKKKTHKTGINRRKHFKKIPMKNQKFINKNKKSNKKFSRKFVGQNKIS